MLVLQGDGAVVEVDQFELLIIIEAFLVLHLFIIHKAVINEGTSFDFIGSLLLIRSSYSILYMA
jgi:hypothetical protein